MKKDIKYAVRNFPLDSGKELIDLFEEVNYLDIYDGDLFMYLRVIHQQVKYLKRRDEEIKGSLKVIIQLYNDIYCL